MSFDFDIFHRSGKLNIADYISRHPVGPKPIAEEEGEAYINAMTDYAVPKSMTRAEIAEETSRDPLLSEARRQLRGEGARKTLDELDRVWSELSVTDDGVVLRGTMIVVPASLQERVVKIAHEGHAGITRTKALLRSKVWFRGLDELSRLFEFVWLANLMVETRSKSRSSRPSCHVDRGMSCAWAS